MTEKSWENVKLVVGDAKIVLDTLFEGKVEGEGGGDFDRVKEELREELVLIEENKEAEGEGVKVLEGEPEFEALELDVDRREGDPEKLSTDEWENEVLGETLRESMVDKEGGAEAVGDLVG